MENQVRKECCMCRYWVRDAGEGLCHANAPMPSVMVGGTTYTLVWPKTGAQDWCGKWEGDPTCE